MNINNKKKIFLLIGILVLTMLIVSGGTFAYFRWISSEDQQTNLAIQIEENISMHIENPALEKTGMYPTNTCTNVAATMSGVSIIALENQTGVIARPKFKLRVKITDKNGNVITNNSAGSANSDNPYRYFINYAVAEENGICTEPLYSGNFDQNAPTYQGQTQWYDSEWITLTSENTGFPTISNGPNTGVSFNGTPYQTTYHNYKVWVWIDESYVSVNTGSAASDLLQDAKIELSWSENSSVEQIKAQAYAVYSNQDQSLRFYQSDEPITAGSTYAGRPVTNVYTGFETESYNDFTEVPWYDVYNAALASYPITKVIVEDTISPISTANWFRGMVNCTYFDVTKLDTSNVINMSSMFWGSGYSSGVTSFTIIGMENWNTTKVTNMSYMFYRFGTYVSTFNISDISGWNVSNVTDMSRMFGSFGTSATNNWLLDLSNWNTYKVTNNSLFSTKSPGSEDIPNEKIIQPEWYTSYAVYIGSSQHLKFYRTTEKINKGDTYKGETISEVYTGFDTATYVDSSQVPWTEKKLSTYEIIVEDKIYPVSTAFWFTGFKLVLSFDMANLDTSNVTDMRNMFYNAGSSVTTNLTGLENWNTSKVINMASMFYQFGSDASTFNISDISRWDTSNVTHMGGMFYGAGANATNDWSLNLSNWNVLKVSNTGDNFTGTGNTRNHIIQPNWIN